MLITCADSNIDFLKRQLEKEYVLNTFLLADLRLYGAKASFLDTWADIEDGMVKGIYMRFFNNLMIYGKQIDEDFVLSILKQYPISVIMGKKSVIEPLRDCTSDKFIFKKKKLLILEHSGFLSSENKHVRKATVSDAERIYEFLQSIPGFSSLYASQEMILERIRDNSGIHMIIERNGAIIAHGNSTASAERTVMLGGVSTALAYRNKGYASEIVSELSREVLFRDKRPCVFCDCNVQNSLFERLGFQPVEEWATLEESERLREYAKNNSQ